MSGVNLTFSVRGAGDADLAGSLVRANERVAQAGLAAARASLAPHTKTGETMRSLNARIMGPDGVEFYDRAPQALFLEEGTRPHEIVPRRARALRWYGPDGAPIFARRVSHPGTAATYWLSRALEAEADTFERIYAGEVEGEWSRG